MRWHGDEALAAFRAEAGMWLLENVPTEPRPLVADAARAYDAAWQRRQYDGGWAGVAWPKAYGGRGLSPVQQLIWYEEMARAKAPDTGAFTVALGHAGPTLIGCGSSKQKDEHLLRILRGEETWCQGFSEPNSGSDLASLRTRGVVDGGELVINGSKIWTTYAHVADFQEMLVRTGAQETRHRGISWVVVPMDSPGLTIRRIPTIDGMAEFCECFYDDVRVPLGNVVGEINDGWRVAMYTLSVERGMGFLNRRLSVTNDVDELIDEAHRRGLLSDTRILSQLALFQARAQAVHALGYDGLTDVSPELLGSINRVFHSELRQDIAGFASDILEIEDIVANSWATRYMLSLSLTIATGTKEIQKNIVAERVLGLPR